MNVSLNYTGNDRLIHHSGNFHINNPDSLSANPEMGLKNSALLPLNAPCCRNNLRIVLGDIP